MMNNLKKVITITMMNFYMIHLRKIDKEQMLKLFMDYKVII